MKMRPPKNKAGKKKRSGSGSADIDSADIVVNSSHDEREHSGSESDSNNRVNRLQPRGSSIPRTISMIRQGSSFSMMPVLPAPPASINKPSTQKKVKRSSLELADGAAQDGPPHQTGPQYRKAGYAISVRFKGDMNWGDNSASNRVVSYVSIPDSRPEGTSGVKEGGHLTPWVAVRSAIHQNVYEGMDIDTAIANVKKLVADYERMPGHSRSKYLVEHLKKIHENTKRKLLELSNHGQVTSSKKEQYLSELIDAYIQARNALPLTAVATADNTGHGEPMINKLLWSYETNQEQFTPKQLSGLLWSLLDVAAADEWASVRPMEDDETANWQGHSSEEEEQDEVEGDPNTWTSYDRRMVEVFVQHVMGMRIAYPNAYKIAKMTSQEGVERLFRWLDKPKKLKQESGIQNVTGKYGWSILHRDWKNETIMRKIAIVLEKADRGYYSQITEEGEDSDM